jgi:hypothetical protein
MSIELLYREDLEPLCPVDFRKMCSNNEKPPKFKCHETGCNICWDRINGYFYPETEDIAKRASTVGFLKMSFVVSMGISTWHQLLHYDGRGDVQ